METLMHPFTLGLILGLVFTVLALARLIAVKMELKRYKKHLSDRMQADAEHLHRERGELESLRKQNENLRLKIGQLEQTPDRRAAREIEILLRAEKRMTIGAPGFAAAWENAKTESLQEMEAEDSGKSLPRRMMAKLFSPTPSTEALPGGDDR